MRRAELICAALLLAGGLVVVAEGWRLRVGWGSDGPEAGFFVFYLGLALMIACALLLTRALVGPDAVVYQKPFVQRAQLAPVMKVLLPAALMIALTHFVGVYVAGALYLGVYMRWIGRHSWVQTVLISLAIPVVTFLIFEVWFLVPMPKGPLEAYLGF